MEEDVLGTMRAAHAPALVACSRCQTMAPIQEMHLVPGDALMSGSEYEQLCPRCYAALLAGERDLGELEP